MHFLSSYLIKYIFRILLVRIDRFETMFRITPTMDRLEYFADVAICVRILRHRTDHRLLSSSNFRNPKSDSCFISKRKLLAALNIEPLFVFRILPCSGIHPDGLQNTLLAVNVTTLSVSYWIDQRALCNWINCVNRFGHCENFRARCIRH